MSLTGNMKSNPVACKFCKCEIFFPIRNICKEGHRQCKWCSLQLNGVCGSCTEPSIAVPNRDRKAICSSFEIDKDQIYKNISLPSTTNESVKILFHKDMRNKEYFQNTEEDSDTICPPSSQFNEPNEGKEPIRTLGNSLKPLLCSLHQKQCSKSCENIDYCTRQILLQLFDGNKKFCGLIEGDYRIGSVESLLMSAHNSYCEKKCESIESCLKTTLEELIKEKSDSSDKYYQAQTEISSNLECKSKLEQNEKLIKEFQSKFNEESNVFRARYRREFNEPQQQFEIVTNFLTTSSTTNIDFSLPFYYNTNMIACPLSNCHAIVQECNFTSHFLQKHKQYVFHTIKPNECVNFFLDPSILELNELNLIECFMAPNIFLSSKEDYLEKYGLPIFIMVFRANLKDFQNIFKNNIKKQYENAEIANKIMESEVADTIFGIRRNIKNDPIKWCCDEILIISPIALIPRQKAFRATMTLYTPQNPMVNFTSSFCMRSIRDFNVNAELVGSSDTICLTSNDIDALTCNGQYAIHCQMMCKFDLPKY